MKKEDKKILAISIAMIAFLALSSFFNLRRQKETGEDFSLKIEEFSFPEVDNNEIPNIKDIISGDALNKYLETEEGSDFVVRKIENKFQLEIPSGWEDLSTEPYPEYDHIMNVSFSAISENKIDPLVISILNFNKESFSSVLDGMEEILNEESVDMLIIDSYEEEGSLNFSAEYEEDDNKHYSKEKIININNDYYLISVMGSLESLNKNHNIINHILESIQIIQ